MSYPGKLAKRIAVTMVLGLAAAAMATDTVIPLWDGPAPGALGDGAGHVPTLTPYHPQDGTANGASVLVLAWGRLRQPGAS